MRYVKHLEQCLAHVSISKWWQLLLLSLNVSFSFISLDCHPLPVLSFFSPFISVLTSVSPPRSFYLFPSLSSTSLPPPPAPVSLLSLRLDLCLFLTPPLPSKSPSSTLAPLSPSRLSEDSQSSLLSKPVSSLFQNWPKPPLPPLPTGSGVPPSAAAASGATSPSASSSTSTRHLQGVEFEMRPPLLRRAPSPSLLPASEHKVSPAPRPSSLPILPSGPLYPGLFDIRSSPTGGAGGSTDPFAPVFVPSHPGMSGGLGGALSGASRSLSPTRLLSLPPDKPFGAKPLGFWTKFDVADWLEWLGLAEHRAQFLDHEIDGSHLPALTKEDYVDLGVTRVGHRMNIDRALKFFLER